MAEGMSKLTVLVPKDLMNGARRAVMIRGTTLAAVVNTALEKLVAHEADDKGQSVESFCRKSVQLRAGRPRKS